MSRKRTAGALALLGLVLALAAGAWLLRDELAAVFAGEPEPVEVSPEAADAAEDKLTRLREDREEARLSDVEISSLLRYRAPAWTTGTIEEPGVRMEGDTVRLSGIVATANLPSHPELDAVRAFLPDSSRIQVTGRLRPLDAGRAAFEVRAVEFAGLPIPERYYADVLARVGRRDEPGLAPNAIAVHLPAGVSSARVEAGTLILSPTP